MRRSRLFWLCNIIVPLLLGLLIYLAYRPEAIITSLLSKVIPITPRPAESSLEKMLSSYGPDILWAYGLTFYNICVLHHRRYSAFKVFLISFITELLIELLQKTKIINGTFDYFDVLLEFLVTTMVIALYYFNLNRNIDKYQNRRS